MQHTHLELVSPLTMESSSQDSSEDPKEQLNQLDKLSFPWKPLFGLTSKGSALEALAC